MEIAGEKPRRVGGIDQKFSLLAHIKIARTIEAFGRPLTIRPISHGGDVAVLGHGDGPVFTVIAEGA